MNKINWKKKLTSRKFWAAIISLVLAIITAFGLDLDSEQVTALGWAFATLIAYIVSEGVVDASHKEVKTESVAEAVADVITEIATPEEDTNKDIK